jgi:glycosyltransferase involved in cell wall biosynthesis
MKRRPGKPLRTVLIFAHECAPYNRLESTVGAQRPAQFAKYLPDFGWRAIVLCCDSNQRRTARRQDLDGIAESAMRRLRDADPSRSVVIPTPSLSADGLLDRWWWSAVSDGRKGPLTNLRRRSLTTAKFVTGDYSQSWQPCARRVAEAIAQEVDIDSCIGEHSPDAGLFLARWFSNTYHVPWVADFRDPILQPLTLIARKAYRPIARRLLRTATCTVNVNRRWAEMDHSLFGCPGWSIANGFDDEEFTSPDRADSGMFTVVYTGRVDRVQRMEIFFEAMAIARETIDAEEFSTIRFLYRGVSCDKVCALAARFALTDIIDAGPHIDRRESLSLLINADLLLLLSVDNARPRDEFYAAGFYPAKVFEYFGARRPILSVPGDGGLLDELIEETATGVVLRSAGEIAGYVKKAMMEWKNGRPLPYEPNERSVSQYTRRNLAGRMAEVLNSAVGLVRASAESDRAKDMPGIEKNAAEASGARVAALDHT